MKHKILSLMLAALVFCITGTAQDKHHGELTANGSLYFRAEPVNNFFNDKTNEVYYYIHLQGTERDNAAVTKRMPLNISVVIDRSGSMEGQKLAYTREAVKYLVNQLDNQDILSIVLYDTNVEVFLEPQRVEDKKKLLERIDKIISTGSTNLEGGIRKGFELARTAKKLAGGDMINRVLLLSDGLANVGISDPVQLSNITRDYFEKDRISISTFGVGADYNEDLMAKIAMQGGGKYYFIQSPETMPGIFAEELQGISQVVAKNTKLTITFPADELSYERTYAYNSSLKGNTLEISFNDIFAKEQKSVLICFKAKNKLKAPLHISCALTYDNSNKNPSAPVADNRTTEIRKAADDKEMDSGYNRSASEGYVLEVTAEMYEEAVHLCDRENFDQGKAKVREAINLLGNHFKKSGENLFLRDFEKKLIEYENLIEGMKKMDRETLRINVKSHKASRFKTISCPSF
ncbi:MAG: uncharacterized protein FD123_3655 [Bacteroidetes bacterium]|nr:MAG: uncharacterized protein FD123_3655 [Bacteroidota bacterium]